jgi:hypothetical protein
MQGIPWLMITLRRKYSALTLIAFFLCLPLAALTAQTPGAAMSAKSPSSAAEAKISAGALAVKLNALAKSLVDAGNTQDDVAYFLMRSAFSCFAEDWGLIRKGAFQKVLADNKAAPERCAPAITALWKTMKGCGGGWLFEAPESMPLTQQQIGVLADVAAVDWEQIDSTIFGTILENALAVTERKQLGTHYTPTPYVERLVVPTIIAPLKDEWAEVNKADASAVKQFHERLCKIVILDPACGSGNFLGTSYELLSALDSEVISALRKLGQPEPSQLISIQQFRGVEIAPHSADVCELVLRVCWLRSYCKTHKTLPPAIDNKRVVECRDALLKLDASGNYSPADPWPQCDFIVGNPPFVGASKMRQTLGDKYTEAVRKTYRISGKADLVMFWWYKAACLVRDGAVQRFGFITTQGIRSKGNTQVISSFLDDVKAPISITFAVPNHPWLTDGAGVRIAMTVCNKGESVPGTLATISSESPTADGYAVELKKEEGVITPTLMLGADLTKIKTLRANSDLCTSGVKLSSRGFVVTAEQAKSLGLGTVKGLESRIHPLCNGKDLTGDPRGVLVLDMGGLSENEVQQQFPAAYQWLTEHVKPEREKNRDEDLRRNWWLFSGQKENLRLVLGRLNRYIATSKVMQRRFFIFLDSKILPDDPLTVFGSDDAYVLGVLSSRVHCDWAEATGSRFIGVLRYDKIRCFDSFPFPDANETQKAHIRDIAEKLDAHRKARQKQHPDLTLAELYGVLEKIQKGEQLTAAEQKISDLGDVPTLKKLHEDLDSAVTEAYGWPANSSTTDIISRLFELNQQRAAEEATGKIRWLRPQFQNGAAR